MELQIAAMCGAVVRHSIISIALCNSVSSDRSGMAASRSLAAAAARVKLVIFASEGLGFAKVANGALVADFFHFGIDDFPSEIPFQECFKIVVFLLWRRDPVLKLQSVALCGAALRNCIVLCNSVSADRSGMAASRFLAAGA